MSARWIVVALVGALSLGALGNAQEKAPARGEVRVYVYDASHRPIVPATEGRVYLELKSGGRRLLKLAPAGAVGVEPTGHVGGQLRPLRTGESIELVVLPAGATVASATRAHLAAPADLEEYACPMKCATDTKPGDCPKCGMTMAPSLLEFEAVVALKMGDDWQNAKGFRFPQFETPRTVREALDRLASLSSEIALLVDSGKLDRIHEPALNVGAIGKALPKLLAASTTPDPALVALGPRLDALGTELDLAGDQGKAQVASRLLKELKGHLETFRSAVR